MEASACAGAFAFQQMIEIRLDLSAFERKARELGGSIEEVPFALARAMTSAAFATRSVLVDDVWPKHVKVRSRGFLGRALRVKPALASEFRSTGKMDVAI